MTKKLAYLAVLVLVFSTFIACRDYGYEFHFSVIGENGNISTGWYDVPANKWHDMPSPVFLRGNKKGQQIELVATPYDGYRVKEWTCNDKIIEGNKTNSFTAIAIDSEHNIVIVTVEFEPILNE